MHTGHSTLRKTAESTSPATALSTAQDNARPLHTPVIRAPLLARTPNLRDGDEASMRRILREYFLDTFTTYESLFECLANNQAFYSK